MADDSTNTTNGEVAAADGGPPKTAKQLEKEAKKAAKLAKFNEKKDKKVVQPAAPKEKVEVSHTGAAVEGVDSGDAILQQQTLHSHAFSLVLPMVLLKAAAPLSFAVNYLTQL